MTHRFHLPLTRDMSVFTRKKTYHLLGVLCMLLLPIIGLGQSKETLQQQRNNIIKEIKATQQLLASNSTERKTTLADLRLLEKQVAEQEKLITNINKEMNLLNKNINRLNKNIKTAEKELADLQDRYAKTMVNAYKKRSANNKLLFVLSSKGFNDAMRRLNYLKKYSQYNKKQAQSIRDKRIALAEEKREVEKEKAEKEQLLATQRQQKTALNTAKAKVAQVYKTLKDEGKDLSAQITQKKEEAQALENEIQRIIAAEIEAERKRLAALNAKNKPAAPATTTDNVEKPAPVVNTYKVTPEVARLSKNFTSNRGKLPWPVQSGVISANYGENASKELAGIKTRNNGIDIRTDRNANVRALFNGTVASITTIPGYNKVVLVKHGEYFTVYGRLQSVLVSVGDKVTTKQTLGVADVNEGVSEVHLEIWKGQQSLNPRGWIAK